MKNSQSAVMPRSTTPMMSTGRRPQRSIAQPVMGAETSRATEFEDVISETRKTGTPNDAAKRGRASWMAPVPTLQRKKFANIGRP